ncbi:MAG: cobalamin B12-binding domain-containing protein [Anaerolinea sp.]|nr:cobalamin B12-binding domain-containing protein [Anaerolinea sp.]
MTKPGNDDLLRLTLIAHVADLHENEVLSLVETRIAAGHDPLLIIEDCQEGLRQVGERYEQQQYYLSGLIMAGEIFREVMEMAQPIIAEKFTGNETGAILLGTVKGDIHDIGKNNLSMLLTCYGFSVYDLGVDVSPSEFLLQAMQRRPNIIGLSGLLTSSYDAMKETIRLIRISGDATIAAIPVVIGGNQLNEQVCQYVGADYWVNDAMTGVRLCQKLLQPPT